MDCKVYAFYRTLRYVVLETGERVPLKHWPGRVVRIFSEGDDVWQLHLDNPEDFEIIKQHFFTPDYWEDRSWVEEYNDIHK